MDLKALRSMVGQDQECRDWFRQPMSSSVASDPMLWIVEPTATRLRELRSELHPVLTGHRR
jgi:hypothetical protein